MNHIDILVPLFKNYELAHRQVDHLKALDERFHPILLDTTPAGGRKDPLIKGVRYVVPDMPSYYARVDTMMHGAAIDAGKKMATSDIIGIVDLDFFWLGPGIFDEVKRLFTEGCVCVGASSRGMRHGRLSNWVAVINEQVPFRQDVSMAWGMFVDRNLALSYTFIPPNQEVGGVLRSAIISKKLKYHSWHGFQALDESWSGEAEEVRKCVSDSYYYGTPNEPWGVHVFGGCSAIQMGRQSAFMRATDLLIEKGKAKWNN